MATRTPMYSVAVGNLRKLEQLPGALAEAQHDFLSDLADELAENVAEAAPGGKAGRIGRTIFGDVVIPDRIARVASTFPGAKAQDVGAYITNKRPGHPIRFEVAGQTIFSRYARIPATRFVRAGLRKRTRVAQDTFDRHFGDLGVSS